ncbi:hypothetical protein EI427_23505 [Flammeovirga pectinis]|uniref:Rpn family recombination-promoting nuclease/putative transposase n=1 Tax=Flammeovirga pectinis TaxID=2494373 RepID=A0A3Q9FPW6_9BACT|nr:hypothetical protein [Flammeovirga pectinis]AZQ65183.1 hypothetical protein EI427_23505 [Flammeovirga pectinis]
MGGLHRKCRVLNPFLRPINLDIQHETPTLLQERTFKKLFKISEYSAMNETDKVSYEESLKTFRDYVNTLDQAKEEGKEEGKKEQAIETAKSMLLDGLSIEKVAQYSGLSIEEVQNTSLATNQKVGD